MMAMNSAARSRHEPPAAATSPLVPGCTCLALRKAARRVSLSVKALEMAEEKEAIEQFGSSDSGASLGDILGAALREKAQKE